MKNWTTSSIIVSKTDIMVLSADESLKYEDNCISELSFAYSAILLSKKDHDAGQDSDSVQLDEGDVALYVCVKDWSHDRATDKLSRIYNGLCDFFDEEES